jgi:flagellar basal-body rod protein FlgF
MSGGSYAALSGMRARLDQLDRLAADLANVGTAGYKTERTSRVEADRPQFDALLQTAIDVTSGDRKLDAHAGAITATGRELDAAIDGNGFFVVEMPAGIRYTRNGHFSARADGALVTDDGGVVQGVNGQITLGPGKVDIAVDGTVRSGGTVVGRLAVMDFPDPGKLVRESASMLRADNQTGQPVAVNTIRSGALEQSNVSVVERIAELSDLTRSFEALQKAVSLQMNDFDGRAIEILGRR